MSWTITHEDSNGERVKTFSYAPHVWVHREHAEQYLAALIERGDLAARIFQDQPAVMASMRVEEYHGAD